jgi:hypothetical protein
MPDPAVDEETLAILVTAAEDRRFEALICGKVDDVDTLLDDDLVFVHSAGLVQGKRDYLHSLRSGSLVYRSISLRGRHVTIRSGVAVSLGTIAIETMAGSDVQRVCVAYTAIYTRDSAPRLVGYHATSVLT